MIKHFSVGKKMAFGFGIMLFLILLATSISVLTAVERSSSLEEMAEMSELQAAIATLHSEYNQASLHANTVILEIDDEAYRVFVESTDEAARVLGAMGEGQLANHPLRDELVRPLEQELVDWVGHVQAVQTYNTSLEEQTRQIHARYQTMTDTADALYRQMLSVDETGAAATAAAELLQAAEHVRIESMAALLLYETNDAAMTAFYRQMDHAQALADQGAQIYGDADGAWSRAGIALADYRTAMEAFVRDSEESVVLHETPAYQLADRISDQVRDLSEAVHVEARTLISANRASNRINIVFLAVLSAVAVLAGIVVATRITTRLTAPLRRMKNLLTRVGKTGTLAFTPEEMQQIAEDAAVRDEVGESVHAFWGLLERLMEISDCLERIAGKDLSGALEPLGEEDTIGLSLKNMSGSLNGIFREINNSAAIVSQGSVEIASGAQMLAQSTTEQAATTQQLEAAVTEVSEQADRCRDMAKMAVGQNEEIRLAAHNGTGHMEQMTLAAQEINAASLAIQSVIKIIDDIAFQTNILALNAAVEAARAGQNGKGFSVVAGEVRNLAAKSAEAARKTDTLISETIAKSEQGLSISQQASESFEGIIRCIEQASGSLESIAVSSEEQAVSITQIRSDIGYIASVTQQNSATSEESASSSEVMRSQAKRLRGLISRFRLQHQEGTMPIQEQPSTPDGSCVFDYKP